MSRLVDFLEGRGTDASGRLIEQVLCFAPAALEHRHDFIQWLFPLPEPSQAVPGSPFLTDHDVVLIRRSESAQENLASAARVMADFYGSSDHWLRPYDHNHLRITRVVKSLRLLVGNDAADQFRDLIQCLADERGQAVNALSRRYWAEA